MPNLNDHSKRILGELSVETDQDLDELLNGAVRLLGMCYGLSRVRLVEGWDLGPNAKLDA